MKTSNLKFLSATAVIGLVSLTGCAGGDDYAAFCDFAEDADAQVAVLDDVALTSDVINAAALENDFGPLNEWGNTASPQIAELIDGLNTAKSGAPDQEAEDALDTLILATSTVKEMADAAASADDFEAFFAETERLSAQMLEVASTGDPDAVLTAKTAEYCA